MKDFTNVPLNKTINIILHRIQYKENQVKINMRIKYLEKID